MHKQLLQFALAGTLVAQCGKTLAFRYRTIINKFQHHRPLVQSMPLLPTANGLSLTVHTTVLIVYYMFSQAYSTSVKDL